MPTVHDNDFLIQIFSLFDIKNQLHIVHLIKHTPQVSKHTAFIQF